MTRFEDLGLSKDAMKAVKRLGYEEATPVQEQAIPVVLEGKDIIAAASTGTGKTAAFLLPTVSMLDKVSKGKRAPRILVVTPTRELAEQIAFVCFKVSRECKQYTTVVYGGKPYGPQIRELRAGTDVLIATPGRLNDLIQRGVVDLSAIQVLVLDEADRMLDMGFLPDVKKIVDLIPEDRQTLLFSATIDSSIEKNLSDLLKDPEVIQIAQRGETAKIVDQYIIPVPQNSKSELLNSLLDEKGYEKVIIFARTKIRAEQLAKELDDQGFDVECIHSDKSQGQRKRALNNFKKGKAGIIVATDVLARGIDIPSVDYVVNYDLPDMAEDYIHRIGRTGRAGQSGFAVSFVSRNSLKNLKAIENLINREIPVMHLESFDSDMSILTSKERSKKAGRKGHKQEKGRKKDAGATYDYTGYGDLRKGRKKRKDAREGDDEFFVERPKSGRKRKDGDKKGSKGKTGRSSNRDNSSRGGFSGNRKGNSKRPLRESKGRDRRNRNQGKESAYSKKARGKASGRNRFPNGSKASSGQKGGFYDAVAKGKKRPGWKSGRR